MRGSSAFFFLSAWLTAFGVGAKEPSVYRVTGWRPPLMSTLLGERHVSRHSSFAEAKLATSSLAKGALIEQKIGVDAQGRELWVQADEHPTGSIRVRGISRGFMILPSERVETVYPNLELARLHARVLEQPTFEQKMPDGRWHPVRP
jgi:hypothetical protein